MVTQKFKFDYCFIFFPELKSEIVKKMDQMVNHTFSSYFGIKYLLSIEIHEDILMAMPLPTTKLKSRKMNK